MQVTSWSVRLLPDRDGATDMVTGLASHTLSDGDYATDMVTTPAGYVLPKWLLPQQVTSSGFLPDGNGDTDTVTGPAGHVLPDTVKAPAGDQVTCRPVQGTRSPAVT